jgi:hypothetical protein
MEKQDQGLILIRPAGTSDEAVGDAREVPRAYGQTPNLS